MKNAGGWEGVKRGWLRKAGSAEILSESMNPDALSHSWKYMGMPPTWMGVEWFGLVMGLGFVLSFGYWCTYFWCAAPWPPKMSAANSAHRGHPQDALPLLVILPGMLAIGIAPLADNALQTRTGSNRR